MGGQLIDSLMFIIQCCYGGNDAIRTEVVSSLPGDCVFLPGKLCLKTLWPDILFLIIKHQFLCYSHHQILINVMP